MDERFKYRYETITMLRGDVCKCILKLRVGNSRKWLSNSKQNPEAIKD